MLASSPVAAPGGDTIGRYELLLELGRGGMAVLYLARARGLGGFSRLFAIKRILPHLAADPVFVEMFLDEGRIAARLSHPNLCPVFELGHDRGELFLVMEYLDGVAWETLAAAAPPAARLGLAAGVLAQACEGLHHAHTLRDVDGTAMPIVHRDVSPQNLMVSSDGVCRVLDFGVSKIATDHRRTRTGVRKGKLPYMAPEQIAGEPVDARADVWAIGAMLWEALTGARLFDRDTDFLIYQAITAAEIPSVNTGGAGARYPGAVDRVIGRALARDRDRRHATARELGRELLDLAAGAASSREAIADAVTALCGDDLAARRRAISSAVALRPAIPSALDRDAVTEPGAAAGDSAAIARDAAETASMAMRRDAIVVDRTPRRRWRAGAIGLAAIAGGIAVVVALRGGAPAPQPGASDQPPVPAAGSSSVAAAPASGRARQPAGEPPPMGAVVAGSSSIAAPPAQAPSRQPAAAGRPPGSPVASTADGAIVPASRAAPSRSAIADRPRERAPSAGSAQTAPAASGSGRLHRPPLAAAPSAGAPAAPPPRDRSADEAVAAVAPPGWYAIDSAPYATIFVDDRKIGDTPLDRISLPAGSHRVRAVLADGRQRTFAIDIAPDRKTSSGTLTW